jgi:hypothetical protein
MAQIPLRCVLLALVNEPREVLGINDAETANVTYNGDFRLIQPILAVTLAIRFALSGFLGNFVVLLVTLRNFRIFEVMRHSAFLFAWIVAPT